VIGGTVEILGGGYLLGLSGLRLGGGGHLVTGSADLAGGGLGLESHVDNLLEGLSDRRHRL